MLFVFEREIFRFICHSPTYFYDKWKGKLTKIFLFRSIHPRMIPDDVSPYTWLEIRYSRVLFSFFLSLQIDWILCAEVAPTSHTKAWRPLWLPRYRMAYNLLHCRLSLGAKDNIIVGQLSSPLSGVYSGVVPSMLLAYQRLWVAWASLRTGMLENCQQVVRCKN